MNMNRLGLRIVENATYQHEAHSDFNGTAQHRRAEPLLASPEAAVDSRLCPQELPFLEEERGKVTILFGGLTWKHERLIEGLLRGAGYRCQALSETDRTAHELGK
jgi:hypothetical protein